ncbi:lytic murein transglycosylase [Phytomonospora sp. NPDC050363]|uniref:lytic transglycosylase domain-containing protein n=1 Tax=Phytomonospora sp. NPDC050363 TaxID=3155642 RepID=UPI0033DF3738
MAGKLTKISQYVSSGLQDAWGSTRRGVPVATRSTVAASRATAEYMRRPGSRFGIQVAVTVVLLTALALLATFVVPRSGGARPVGAGESSGTAGEAPIALPPGAQAIPGAPNVPQPTPTTGVYTPPPSGSNNTPSSTLAGWATKMSAKVGVSARALQAYGFAELRLATAQPNCKLSWTTLAGIGSVETNHGTTGGTSLDAGGRPLKAIRGPALDGTNNNQAIADTDDGAWDGDTVWDRAIGPMQFIPTTWKNWATDADGDGDANPNDIDDVALAAAKYLCAGNRDLSTAQGWYDAVFSYNHVNAYVLNVYGRADEYGRKSAA